MLKQTIRISLELNEFKRYTILKILKYIDEFFRYTITMNLCQILLKYVNSKNDFRLINKLYKA